MKEQYQNELSQVRAPKELIEKTKLAMKQEEEKKTVPVTRKVNTKWVLAAAAVVLLVTVSVGVLVNQKTEVENPIQLGMQEQKGPVDIEKADEISFGELTIKKTDKAVEEIQGNNVVLQEIHGVQVTVYTNVITGCYQCFLEREGQSYVISSKITEREAFVNEVESYLKQAD